MPKPIVTFHGTLPNAFPMIQACLDVAQKVWTPEQTDAFLKAAKAGAVSDIPSVCRKFFDVRVIAILPSRI